MRFASLGSGSSGNATVITAGDTCVLLDCGFTIKETERLEEALVLDTVTDAEIERTPARLRFTPEEELPREERSEEVA